jgi:hypothetical protein
MLSIIASASPALADPPERVARISFVSGAASFRTATAPDWSSVSLNYPLTVGDDVWTDRTGRIELQMGATAVNLDAMTAASVINLDRRIVQLRLVQGAAIARVRELAPDESVEIDTPNGAVTLLRPGLYRIDVAPAGDATTVTVRRGDAEVATAEEARPVHAGASLTTTGREAALLAAVPPVAPDEFEDWVTFRDRRVDELTTVRYVPRAVVGYDDLDEFGTWRLVADYGPVWVPHVRPGWAPYRFGHWAWINPWGWTWVDDAPWGFAPFHYGRWAYVGDGWVWVPGAIVERPVYAPALVAFVGGANWRIGVNIGAPVGWFPLGPREVFVPAYTVSPGYLVALNRPHVSVTNVNVNVTNVTYVNRTAPGAITVVSRETFTQARPVAAAAVAVAPQALATAVVVGHAAPREIAPASIPLRPAVVAPAPSITTRAVIVRTPAPSTTTAMVVRRTNVAPVTPLPGPASARVAPSPAPPPAAVAAAPPAVATHASPDAAAAIVAARHAQERMDIEARHATERAALQARQAAEANKAASAASAEAQRELHARLAREQAALEARQKAEHEQMHTRQDAERRH